MRLARVTLNAFDVEALAAFYVDVLDFERIDAASASAAWSTTSSTASSTASSTIALRLGDSRLDLVAVPHDARPYPRRVAGWNPLFQHCAIVVGDMTRAMDRLQRSTAWSPISVAGPETLPANTGRVTAFKFRDPEGHPLELLAFVGAAGHAAFVRIDHSALSVVDVDRSVAFYGGLGLQVTGRSLNVGIEQQRLDDVAGATVDVVALTAPAAPRPHVELLGYRGDHPRDATPAATDDIAATRLVFEVADRDALMNLVMTHAHRLVDAKPEHNRRGATLRDPDGHLLVIEVAR